MYDTDQFIESFLFQIWIFMEKLCRWFPTTLKSLVCKFPMDLVINQSGEYKVSSLVNSAIQIQQQYNWILKNNHKQQLHLYEVTGFPQTAQQDSFKMLRQLKQRFL